MKFCLLKERKLKRKPTDKEKLIDLSIKSQIGYAIGYINSMCYASLRSDFPELNKELKKWWNKEGKIKYAKEIKEIEKYSKKEDDGLDDIIFDELTTEEIKTLREMIKEYKNKIKEK
jgi:hypothetical protein